MTSTRVTRIGTGAPYGSDVVPSPAPVLSWVTQTDVRDWRQAGAEISYAVEGQEHLFALEGTRSVGVAWPFAELAPRQDGRLRVRVRGTDGQWSPWSGPRAIVAGFLGEAGWQAATIGASSPASYAEPVLLRTEFTLDRPVARAFFYATALGVYQAAVNGADVDDHVMKPGWTAYQERVLHETTDITALVRDGVNAIGVRLAGGWATQHYGFAGNWHPVYGEQPRFAGQIVIEHTDGTVRTIATGDDWMLGRGPITQSGLYDGEAFDARRAAVDGAGVGFAEPGFVAAGWEAAAVHEPVPVPETSAAPFVRRIEDRAVEEVILTPSGRTVLDFGQNLVGRLRIRVSGPAGTVVTLRHAEVLEHGELGIRPLREAKATDTYILAGSGEEIWEPEFTFHGFRYAEVEGWPGTFDPDDVTAVVIHSDMERTGWFETSHPLLNRLHENVVWGLRGNFLSIPTDCPQRDERLGWTGDIQVFAPTASFLYDVRGFLDSWLTDLTIDQVDGVVPFVVPNVLGPAQPAAAWGDAATVVPDVLYRRFGDDEIVRRQYPSMKGWVDALLERAGERRLWEGSFQFGDWLDPDAPPHNAAKAKTDPDIVATASLFDSARTLARTAARLGLDEDARHYEAVAEEVRVAFLAEYVTPAGRMVSDAQTAYALAIVFGIVSDEMKPALGARLAALSRANGYHIGTGFVGTPIIQDALTQTGHIEAARRLLLQTASPSWLYPVTMGATTIWERWDSMLPDGKINPGEMTSFNHYALGAVADWMQRVIAGLAPAAPGYERIEIAPHPLAGIDSAAATHVTPFGAASVAWRRSGDTVEIEAVVPANTTAAVHLPDGTQHEVGSGAHAWRVTTPLATVTPGTVDLDTGLDVIIDDEEAHGALMAELLRFDVRAAETIRSHTSWGGGSTVRSLLNAFPGKDLADVIAARFGQLNARRAGSVPDAGV